MSLLGKGLRELGQHFAVRYSGEKGRWYGMVWDVDSWVDVVWEPGETPYETIKNLQMWKAFWEDRHGEPYRGDLNEERPTDDTMWLTQKEFMIRKALGMEEYQDGQHKYIFFWLRPKEPVAVQKRVTRTWSQEEFDRLGEYL